MTKQSLHFALLVCDTPPSEVVTKYGDYTKQYPVVFGKAADNKDLAIIWDFFDVVEAQEYPFLKDVENKKYDAIVLSGSKFNAHDDTPWIIELLKFLKTVQSEGYSDRVKLVGICFGHQIILRAAGGTTGRNEKGWEVGYYEIELTPFGKGFFNTEKTKLRINQIHRDSVSILPKGFNSLAFTKEHTENHATVSENGQCITVQGHPEFIRDTMITLVQVRTESGVFTKDLSSKWLNTLNTAPQEMDDIWLVEKFLDFIRL